MIREVKFESQDRRIKGIIEALNANGIKDIEEANAICDAAGLDPYKTCEETQPICFENAKWAYVVGAAIAIKKGCKNAADAAEAIGIGLQAFCIPGSVADDRKVGIGHGNLAAMLLREETKCFAFLAGHESFAAAEGAIKIAAKADKVRKEPLRCILNGLGKDAAQIISRINGFTYVQTQFDYYTSELKVVREIAYSDGERAKVKCYGCDDVREGVAVMWKEGVDVSITGNSTNPTRFQHPVAGTYKKERMLAGKPYFSVASGGGTGRTLHPDNMAAGPASYGMTDTMGRMHSDAQFAGSSSVPAHVEMMGFFYIVTGSSISPNISSTRSSSDTMPDVPPNSSTTTATVFFCCMKSFISLCAAMVSGTMGTSFTLFRQSTGLRNISDEWIYPTTLSILPSYTIILEIPDSTKRLFKSSRVAVRSTATISVRGTMQSRILILEKSSAF